MSVLSWHSWVHPRVINTVESSPGVRDVVALGTAQAQSFAAAFISAALCESTLIRTRALAVVLRGEL